MDPFASHRANGFFIAIACAARIASASKQGAGTRIEERVSKGRLWE
jgi:hypothetical protein